MDEKEIGSFVLISGMALVVSLFFIYFGGSIPPAFVEEETRTATMGIRGGEHHNLFRQLIRVSGFAEDANNATLASAIAFFTAWKLMKKGVWKKIYMSVQFVAISLSFSRTVLLGIVIAALLVLFADITRRKIKGVDTMIMTAVICSCFVAPYLPYSKILITVQTRFRMWRTAGSLFPKHPLLSSGLGSFRYFHGKKYHFSWMVQCHNIYWKILSEHGMIVFLFFKLLRKHLECVKTRYQRMIMLLYLIFACAFETVYLQFLC